MTYSSTQAIGISPVGIRRLTVTGMGPISRIHHILGLAVAAIGRDQTRSRNLRVLSQLDDRLLLDIGFSRFDIEHLCSGGR